VTFAEDEMSIAVIQINCTLLEGETLADLLMKVGDLLAPFLDPHEDDEPCVRDLEIEGFQLLDEDEEYGMIFTPDDEDDEELIGIGVPQRFRDAWKNN
jgi:hypothetical protein